MDTRRPPHNLYLLPSASVGTMLERRKRTARITLVLFGLIASLIITTSANAYASTITIAGSRRSQTIPAPVTSDNGGAFIQSSAATSSLAPAVTPQTATVGCTGWWFNGVANVLLQETNLGGTARAVAWGFFLTNQARDYLGPVATVSMPFTYVNGGGINPPYGPHTESVYYNFHGSLSRYVIIGAIRPTLIQLQAGDTLTLYWLINSNSQSGHGAYRYITCRV